MSQELFLKLFEAGLAERKKAPVNWCPSCQTVLANEQVVKKSKVKSQKSKPQLKSQNDDTTGSVEISVCERCDTPVEQRELEQWFLKITKYADRLRADLDGLDWPEEIKEAQRNWIGRSEGALLKFKIKSEKGKITIQNEKVNGVGVFLETTDGDFLFQERDSNTIRDPGMIVPFGGSREEGEDLMSTAERELKEELELDVKREHMSVVADFSSHNMPGQYIRILYASGIEPD